MGTSISADGKEVSQVNPLPVTMAGAGQKTAANSQSVVPASDSPAWNSPPLNADGTPYGSATATITQVTVTTSATALKTANSNRKGLALYNGGTVDVLVKLGGTSASATSFTFVLKPGAYYEVPFNHTGALGGICASGSAVVQVTEFT